MTHSGTHFYSGGNELDTTWNHRKEYEHRWMHHGTANKSRKVMSLQAQFTGCQDHPGHTFGYKWIYVHCRGNRKSSYVGQNGKGCLKSGLRDYVYEHHFKYKCPSKIHSFTLLTWNRILKECLSSSQGCDSLTKPTMTYYLLEFHFLTNLAHSNHAFSHFTQV